jgi:hypothetical protein
MSAYCTDWAEMRRDVDGCAPIAKGKRWCGHPCEECERCQEAWQRREGRRGCDEEDRDSGREEGRPGRNEEGGEDEFCARQEVRSHEEGVGTAVEATSIEVCSKAEWECGRASSEEWLASQH